MSAVRSPRPPLGRGWFFAALAIILLATLPPQPSWPRSHTQFFSSLLPGSTGGVFDIVQNVVLYVPLGFVLAGRRATVLRTCWIAALLSFLTELLQFVVPGRSPALRDVVVNSLGALTGHAVWSSAAGHGIAAGLVRVQRWGSRARTPSPRLASTLSIIWAAAVATVLAGTGMLLSPAPPPHTYWVASPYIDAGDVPLYIGSSGTGEGHYRGVIDEVRIFSRARPPESIAEDMMRPAAAPAVSAGLVAAFSFDRESQSVARDDSGHGLDGAVQGASFVRDGRIGGALSFDGIASEVIVPHHSSLDLRDGMTLEAWVRPEANATREPALISRRGSLYFLAESSADGPFYAAGGGRFGGVPRYARLTAPLEPEQWTHLAVTYDGEALRLYRNGLLDATQLHWSPHRPERATVNGIDLVRGRVRESGRLRAHLRGDLAIAVAVRCGTVSAHAAPVFLVEGFQDTEVFALDAAGPELRLRAWTWARKLNLASPPARIAHAFGACASGDLTTFDLAGRLQNPAVTRDGQALAVVSAGLGSAWAFVWHAELAPLWMQVALSCAWLAFLAGPIAYWSRSLTAGAFAAAVVMTACVMVPYAFHIRGLNGVELAGLAAGGALGLLSRINQQVSAS